MLCVCVCVCLPDFGQKWLEVISAEHEADHLAEALHETPMNFDLQCLMHKTTRLPRLSMVIVCS